MNKEELMELHKLLVKASEDKTLIVDNTTDMLFNTVKAYVAAHCIEVILKK